MNFGQALEAVKAGRTVYRTGAHERWTAALVQSTDTRFGSQIMTSYPGTEKLLPFAGAQDDLLAEDWEIADDAPGPV